MRHLWLACALIGMSGTVSASPTSEASVRAADGTAVYVYEYPPTAAPRDAPLLMFHMAGGDARGELDEIARRLAGRGHRVFAADLRGGGSHFRERDPASANYINQTSQAFAETPPLCSAYADAEAALNHVRQTTGRRAIVTGSSYSAALAVQLAARRPEAVQGFVAFSPASGEPMMGCEPEPWLAELQVPGWAVRPREEAEIDWVRAQRETWSRQGVQTGVYALGSHGTSILVPRRARGDSEPVWGDFERFLDSLGPDEPVELASGSWRLKGDFRRAPGETGDSRPAVLLLNTTAGDRRAHERLAGELAHRGIASLRIDLRGHGESDNAGRFDPEQPDMTLIEEAWRDVEVALRALKSISGVDATRIAIVGAGYSGEAMAEAARQSPLGYVRSYVGLSPGSFSEESARAIDGSGARWLLMHSRGERFAPAAVERARGLSRTAEIQVVEGVGHGTDLLRMPAATPARLADWLAATLH